jgi:hypothetical protein
MNKKNEVAGSTGKAANCLREKLSSTESGQLLLTYINEPGCDPGYSVCKWQSFLL